MKKEGLIFIFVITLSLLSIGFVSAGLGDWINDVFTIGEGKDVEGTGWLASLGGEGDYIIETTSGSILYREGSLNQGLGADVVDALAIWFQNPLDGASARYTIQDAQYSADMVVAVLEVQDAISFEEFEEGAILPLLDEGVDLDYDPTPDEFSLDENAQILWVSYPEENLSSVSIIWTSMNKVIYMFIQDYRSIDFGDEEGFVDFIESYLERYPSSLVPEEEPIPGGENVCEEMGYSCTSPIRGCGHYEQFDYLCESSGTIICCEDIPYCGDGVCFDHELEDYGEDIAMCPQDCNPFWDSFRITDLDNFNDQVMANEKMYVEVETWESDGTYPEPSEGFNVQYYISYGEPGMPFVSGGNAEYIGEGRWAIEGNFPSLTGNYFFDVALYCARDDAICTEKYGSGAQINIKPELFVEGSNIPPERTMSTYLEEGWNLIYGFAEPNQIIGGEILEEDIKATYVLMPNLQEYARAWPDLDHEMISTLDEDEILNMGFWVYSDKKGAVTYRLYADVRPLEVRTMYEGWNFVGITEDMLGERLDDLVGDCTIERSYFFDGSQQDWRELELSNGITDYDALGQTWVIRVSENCRLGRTEKPIPVPPSLPGINPEPGEEPEIEFEVPDSIAEYALYSTASHREDCDLVESGDIEGTNISGELCGVTSTAEYWNTNTNEAIFIHLTKYTKGFNIIESYFDIYASPAEIGLENTYRLENHEIFWFTDPEEDIVLFTQEATRREHDQGASYIYGEATGTNPVTHWFYEAYSPI